MIYAKTKLVWELWTPKVFKTPILGKKKAMTPEKSNLSKVERFLVDGGYSGENFANAIKELCGAEVEVVKRNELHKFVVLPRRWVVERSFGWITHAVFGRIVSENSTIPFK